jgi:hypothetical protein
LFAICYGHSFSQPVFQPSFGTIGDPMFGVRLRLLLPVTGIGGDGLQQGKPPTSGIRLALDRLGPGSGARVFIAAS